MGSAGQQWSSQPLPVSWLPIQPVWLVFRGCPASAADAGSNFSLQTLHFFPDALDLLIFLGFFKRLAVTGERPVGFSGLLVGVGEVFDDGGIVHGDLYRPLQKLYGLIVIAFLIVTHTQPIDLHTHLHTHL